MDGQLYSTCSILDFKSLGTCFAVFVVALYCSEEISMSAGRIVLSMKMA